MKMTKRIEFDDEKKPAIVFLCIALAMLLAFIGFFSWHTARMRNYELNYERGQGTIIAVEVRHSSTGSHRGSRTYYYFVVSYEYGGQEYTFVDRTGHNYVADGIIGSSVEIFVNPQSPEKAEVVTSADFVSIICACFFAFFCVTYAAGMNILLSTKRNTFKKRIAFVWGAEILLGIAFLLLFWLGLPNSGFGEVFVRIKGAIGVAVVSQIVALIAFIDAIITFKINSKLK